MPTMNTGNIGEDERASENWACTAAACNTRVAAPGRRIAADLPRRGVRIVVDACALHAVALVPVHKGADPSSPASMCALPSAKCMQTSHPDSEQPRSSKRLHGAEMPGSPVA